MPGRAPGSGKVTIPGEARRSIPRRRHRRPPPDRPPALPHRVAPRNVHRPGPGPQSSGESGRTGALARVEPYNWWAFYGTACDQLKPVWCIELDRTLEDPGAPTALLVNGVSYPDGTVQTTASQGGMRSYYFTDGWAYWGDSACASGYHAATIWEILDPSNLRYAFEVPGAANYGEPEKGIRIPAIRVSTGSKGSGESIGVLCGDGSGKTTRADPRRGRGGSSICGYGLGTYQWWDLNSWCLEVVNCSDGGHAPCISD